VEEITIELISLVRRENLKQERLIPFVLYTLTVVSKMSQRFALAEQSTGISTSEG
jgi:hypothetical protein